MKARRFWPFAVCLALSACAGAGQSAAPPSSAGAPSSTDAKPERAQVTAAFGTTSGSSAALWIAGDRGFFQKYGLNVNIQYAESSAATAALLAGEAQFGHGDAPTAFAAYQPGNAMKIVAVLNKTNSYSIVARPDIKTPADLKGKSLAVAKPGDTSDISARIALKPAGLTLGSDVTELSVGNSAPRLAALLSGQVAAAVLSEAFVDQAVAQGMHILVSLEQAKIPYMAQAVQVTEGFAKGNHNTVLAYLKGLVEGVKFFADDANKKQSEAVLAQYLKTQPDDPAVENNYRFYHDRLAHDLYPDKEGADTALEAMKAIDPGRYSSMTSDLIIDSSFASELRASGFQKAIWGE